MNLQMVTISKCQYTTAGRLLFDYGDAHPSDSGLLCMSKFDWCYLAITLERLRRLGDPITFEGDPTPADADDVHPEALDYLDQRDQRYLGGEPCEGSN